MVVDEALKAKLRAHRSFPELSTSVWRPIAMQHYGLESLGPKHELYEPIRQIMTSRKKYLKKLKAKTERNGQALTVHDDYDVHVTGEADIVQTDLNDE